MTRILVAAIIITTIAKPAYAYIDVAIGGLILQALIGGFFAFLVIWRDWITRLKNFFKGKGFINDTVSSEEKEDAEGQSAENDNDAEPEDPVKASAE
nr:hypothetical protein [Cytophagales bacterium]